ncbi:unnamed protein product [Timema podura]|uniref:Uncharacterized protein n=1 Tax=Timema podura TaxID=61482 RepID=A0ABN7NR25_TIMPD|nr:unnamed protein product [Timema podura]
MISPFDGVMTLIIFTLPLRLKPKCSEEEDDGKTFSACGLTGSDFMSDIPGPSGESETNGLTSSPFVKDSLSANIDDECSCFTGIVTICFGSQESTLKGEDVGQAQGLLWRNGKRWCRDALKTGPGVLLRLGKRHLQVWQRRMILTPNRRGLGSLTAVADLTKPLLHCRHGPWSLVAAVAVPQFSVGLAIYLSGDIVRMRFLEPDWPIVSSQVSEVRLRDEFRCREEPELEQEPKTMMCDSSDIVTIKTENLTQSLEEGEESNQWHHELQIKDEFITKVEVESYASYSGTTLSHLQDHKTEEASLNKFLIIKEEIKV